MVSTCAFASPETASEKLDGQLILDLHALGRLRGVGSIDSITVLSFGANVENSTEEKAKVWTLSPLDPLWHIDPIIYSVYSL